MTLTSSQRWGLACAAMLADRYALDSESLGSAPPPLTIASWSAGQLRDLTGAHGRGDLRAQLEIYLREGSAVVFERQRAWARALPREARSVGFRHADAIEQKGRLFAVEHDHEVGVTGWDAARVVLYATLGYRAGMLSWREALAVVLRVARMAQAAYRSWEELARGYVVGRWCWAGAWDAETARLEARCAELLVEGPWATLPWAMALSDELPPDVDPGGALHGLAVRPTIECGECAWVVPVREVAAAVACGRCGATTALAALWTTLVGVKVSEPEEDDEDDYGDEEEADPAPIPASERLSLAEQMAQRSAAGLPVLDQHVNYDEQLIRVAFLHAAPACRCGAVIGDDEIRRCAPFACACGATVAIAAAPAALREADWRARYVVGAGELDVTRPWWIVFGED